MPICFRCAAFLAVTCSSPPAGASEQACGPLSDVNRLVLVTSATIDEASARIVRFERDRPGAPWRALGKPERAVIGRHGLAWGWPFRAAARGGEPIKREGDGRTPAGFYRIGRSFGFSASTHAAHLLLRPGQSICVDDPGSPAYNRIVSAEVERPRPAGEDMGSEPLYRRGLVIDYPSDAGARAGSCIFLHVWRGPAKGTAGCVALPEPRVAALQDFARQGAVIAILPKAALGRFSACLPQPEPRPHGSSGALRQHATKSSWTQPVRPSRTRTFSHEP